MPLGTATSYRTETLRTGVANIWQNFRLVAFHDPIGLSWIDTPTFKAEGDYSLEEILEVLHDIENGY